jgi:hypothetical protein
MAMIKVFLPNDTKFTTNGEKIIKSTEAIITKNLEEEYIEVEAPLEYAEFLIQENILLVDTLTGKKGYRIHNPVTDNNILVKAWLCYQENPSVAADRGVVISHGKNLEGLEVTENWDDVVTKITPVGYNGAKLPEVTLTVTHGYARDYIKTIEFDLSESLEETIKTFEDTIEIMQSLEATLKTSITTLQAKYDSYDTSIASMQSEKEILQQRLLTLGNTEAELKEKAAIQAQIPLINTDIASLQTEKADTLVALNKAKSDLVIASQDVLNTTATYNSTIVDDLRAQAQAYLNANQYPKINYNLSAHLEGILEIGDTVKVKHPAMRVDLLTNVNEYEFDCLTMRFVQIEFGVANVTLKSKITEIEESISKVSKEVNNANGTISRFYSEFKRDSEELLSTFVEEIYGGVNGLYGMITKNQSVFRQTASEISATVSRTNANLSSSMATLSLRADQIQLSVTQLNTNLSSQISSLSLEADQIQLTVTNLDRDLTTAKSSITQQANQISLRVEKGKVISEINQTAETVKISASKIDLEGMVTVIDLKTAGQTVINGANITTGIIKSKNYAANSRGMQIDLDNGTIDSKGFKVLSDGNATFSNGAVAIDDSNIIIQSSDGYLKAKSGSRTFNLIGFTSSAIYIGSRSYDASTSYLYMMQRYINIGYTGGTSTPCDVKFLSDRMGFFGATPTTRKYISKLTGTQFLSSAYSTINEILTALASLGIITSS